MRYLRSLLGGGGLATASVLKSLTKSKVRREQSLCESPPGTLTVARYGRPEQNGTAAVSAGHRAAPPPNSSGAAAIFPG